MAWCRFIVLGEEYRPYFQRTVVVSLDCLVAPSKANIKASLCFVWHKAFPGFGHFLGWLLLKAFIGRGIDHSSLQQSTTLQTGNWENKKLGKEEIDKEDKWGNNCLKSTMYPTELRRADTHTCRKGMGCMLRESLRRPQAFTSLWLSGTAKQGMKAKAEL